MLDQVAINIDSSILLKAKIKKLPHLKKDLYSSHLPTSDVFMPGGNLPQ